MTSPVDTSVKWFSSKMPGAPIRNATPGSLISTLDACLVTGWGVQTASSVVVAGGVCTATFAFTHAALLHSVVLVVGASKTELNGEQKVTATGGNTISWTTTASNGADAGSVTVKMAPLGFSKVFAGTNLAVYRSNDPRSNRHFLRVDDRDGLHARVKGYENMTGISTGTGMFPTEAQLSGGGAWGKGLSPSDNPTPWFLAGDSMAFFVGCCAVQSNGSGFELYEASTFDFFGDPLTYAFGGDAFSTTISTMYGDQWQSYPSGIAGGAIGHLCGYTPRDQSGGGTSQSIQAAPYCQSLDMGPVGAALGRIHLVPVYVVSSSAAYGPPRFELPGILVSPQKFLRPMPTAGLPLRIGNGADTDRLLVFIGPYVHATDNFSSVLIDIHGPWRA